MPSVNRSPGLRPITFWRPYEPGSAEVKEAIYEITTGMRQ